MCHLHYGTCTVWLTIFVYTYIDIHNHCEDMLMLYLCTCSRVCVCASHLILVACTHIGKSGVCQLQTQLVIYIRIYLMYNNNNNIVIKSLAVCVHV